MAYKPTGRPRGRPKTKYYKTFLARIPLDLAELIEQYAAERRQPISVLIREGLEWRISEGDPRGMGLAMAQPMGISERVYSSNTEIALGEVQALLMQQAEHIQALTQALERKGVAGDNGLYSSNTETVASASGGAVAPKVKADKATVVPRIRQLREAGLDSVQIAGQFQAEGIPTLSGRGEWQAGTVRKLLLVT